MASILSGPSGTTPSSITISKVSNQSKKQKLQKFKEDNERDEFSKRLIAFHRHKNINSPLITWPSLNGKSIDLLRLYTIVSGLGGWERVCEKDTWNKVAAELDPVHLGSCTNSGHALKLIYIRYLSVYEKFNQITGVAPGIFLDPIQFNVSLASFNMNMINSSTGSMLLSVNSSTSNTLSKKDDDEDSSKKRFSYLIDSTPMIYNYSQHQINLHNKQFNPYEKLELSLLSGLPNEIDFVFNSILLLSSDEYHAFRIHQSPKLIDILLAHVGFFGTNKVNAEVYRKLYDNAWSLCDKETQNSSDHDQVLGKLRGSSRRNFVKFWHNAIQPPIDSSSNGINENKLIQDLLPKLYNECKKYFHKSFF